MYDPLVFWERNAQNWIKRRQPTDAQWSWIEPYINQDWNVIELGCGDGRWAPYFDHYTGADISPTLVVEAKEKYPDKQFFHHDMRAGLKKHFDLIFTFTSWLHLPPEDIAKVQLPDTNYLFIEPHAESMVDYCFKHDYPALFGVKELGKRGKLTIYGRFK